jgi:hypothetical protein
MKKRPENKMRKYSMPNDDYDLTVPSTPEDVQTTYPDRNSDLKFQTTAHSSSNGKFKNKTQHIENTSETAQDTERKQDEQKIVEAKSLGQIRELWRSFGEQDLLGEMRWFDVEEVLVWGHWSEEGW